MKKINLIRILGLVFGLSAVAGGALIASAQTTGTPISVPFFYATPSGGTPVNQNNTTPIPAGTYYNQAGQALEYYGNGTYYNSSTQTYGGTVADPSGVAGIFMSNSAVAPITSPSAPNTGIGGNSVMSAWAALILSGLICVGSVMYIASRRTSVAFPNRE